VSTEDAEPFALAKVAAEALRRRCGGAPFDVAVVLGSGWAAAADGLGPPEIEIPVIELPGFVASTVPGHQSVLRAVRVGDHRVLVLLGRAHLYEGHTAVRVVHAVRSAVLAGASTVLLTNAAGALDSRLRPGRPVLLDDQLNLTGHSPLVGPLPPAWVPERFVDLTSLYAERLREVVRSVYPDIATGVYAGVAGPQFETPAEVRALARAGAQLVGMSTVLEAIAARHLGADVLGISLVTNLAAGVGPGPCDHRKVLEAGAAAAAPLGRLLLRVVAAL
jgi:purine-nucleoside phosphorylase